MSTQKPPALPAGYKEHHVVVLEAVHVAMPTFDFPHKMTSYQRTAPSEIAERIRDATIVISNVADVTPSDMDGASNMMLLAVMATGMGWVDKEYCAKRNISVVNCPQSNVDAVSEHALTLYLSSRKRIPEVDRRGRESDLWKTQNTVAKKVWPKGPTLGIRQETLGIIGYGALGKNVVKLFQALGTPRVLISERKGVKGNDVRKGRVEFDEMLKNSTTIVVLCPREPDTINLIDEPELQAMREDCLLINIARGGIVNEASLTKALRERWIFGAAVDVLDDEPGGPGTTPLIPDLSDCKTEDERYEKRVPNLIVSCHTAWFSGSTIEKLQTLLKAGVEGFVNGRLEDEDVRGNVAVHDGKIWK